MKNILSSIAILGLLVLASPSYIQAQFVPTPLAEKGYDIIGTSGVASVGSITAGTGYTSAPTVSFTGGSGGGNPPAATARLKVVGSVTVVSGGTGYADGDTIKVTGGTSTTAMILTVAETAGVIDSLTVTNAGVYSVPVTTTGAATTTLTGTGTGATITLGWGVASVVITSEGTGYLTAPTVVFTGGGGSSAAGTAVLNAAATAEHTVRFRAILPMSSTVVESITFPTTLGGANGTYTSHSGIVGKTLTAGVQYPVFGNSIKLASGTALLIRR